MRNSPRILAGLVLLVMCTTAMAQDSFKDVAKTFTANYRAKDYDAALKTAQKGLELAENNDEKAQAYTLIGTSYFKLDQTDKAVETIETAEKLDGLTPRRLATLHWTKAGFYYSSQQYEKARDTYKKVTDNEEASATLRTRGILYSANTYTAMDPPNHVKAREMLESVKDLAYATTSDKAEAVYYISLIDRTEKNYDAANEKLESILEIEGISESVKAKYQSALADNSRMAGQTEKAVAAYQKLVDDDKNSSYVRSRALLMIGTTYAQANENEKARKAYQTLIDMEDAFPPYVKNAERYIDRLKKE